MLKESKRRVHPLLKKILDPPLNKNQILLEINAGIAAMLDSN